MSAIHPNRSDHSPEFLNAACNGAPMQIIFATEIRTHAATVLIDANGKVGGNPYIQHATGLVCHDIGPSFASRSRIAS